MYAQYIHLATTVALDRRSDVCASENLRCPTVSVRKLKLAGSWKRGRAETKVSRVTDVHVGMSFDPGRTHLPLPARSRPSCLSVGESERQNLTPARLFVGPVAAGTRVQFRTVVKNAGDLR